jgi:flagellar biosynthesis protein FlhA
MANPLQTGNMSDRSNIYLAVAVISILALMILPIPPFIMDVFLVMSITGALVILFVALYIHIPWIFLYSPVFC